tara:strand:+ start:218 stop:370 length:153 start_codon:yes stop_codon:yes gene_type:complete
LGGVLRHDFLTIAEEQLLWLWTYKQRRHRAPLQETNRFGPQFICSIWPVQ